MHTALTGCNSLEAHDGFEAHDRSVFRSLAFLQHYLHFVASWFEVVRVSKLEGYVDRLV